MSVVWRSKYTKISFCLIYSKNFMISRLRFSAFDCAVLPPI